MSSPFGTDPLDEVPLSHAPLARVLTQVRFPRLSALTVNDDAAHEIAARLATGYPLLSEGQDVMVTISPEGVTQQPAQGRRWQLQDAAQEWQVTFGREFVAMHTSAYTKREDFVARLGVVVECFAGILSPPFSERVGVRYINRLEGADLADVPQLVRSEVLGGLAIPTAAHGVEIAHTLSEALYKIRADPPELGDALHVRWGQLPAGAVLDPTVPAADAPTWVLDIDSFRAHKGEFTVSAISADVRLLAERAYRFFRWAVTEDFLARFGGAQ